MYNRVSKTCIAVEYLISIHFYLQHTLHAMTDKANDNNSQYYTNILLCGWLEIFSRLHLVYHCKRPTTLLLRLIHETGKHNWTATF